MNQILLYKITKRWKEGIKGEGIAIKYKEDNSDVYHRTGDVSGKII